MQKQVLIVDDSRVARLTLKKALSPHGVEITEARSAEEAINYLETSEHCPDIIFMDVTMTGIDGLTATKQIKTNPKFAAIPVVICTGNQTELDKKNALAAGAISVLSKPPESHLVTGIMTALKQRPVDVKPDTDVLMIKLIKIIEQKLLPRLIQQTQEIAFDAVKKASADSRNHFEDEVDKVRKGLEEQLLATLTRDSLIALKPMIEWQVNNLLSTSARQAIQVLVDDLDLSKQASDALATHTQSWITKQQSTLQVELNMQIGPKVTAAVNQHLTNSLATKMAPLVTSQVDKHLASQQIILDVDNRDENEKHDQIIKRIHRLNVLVMGLVVIVAILAFFVLG
ncbi:MAG: CheY-like chemotaxis protein [Methylophagaceae bacterium]|jgi:CheY-like chemotaxis protein